MKGYEINVGALVGPTHTFGGLSWGNEASLTSQNSPSNPRQAALQSLNLMKLLSDRGVKQIVLPPQERPLISVLKKLGFKGSAEAVLAEVLKKAPELLKQVSSSSSMWTANAATITPSIDSQLKRVQITPANLQAQFHRSLEPHPTAALLKRVFNDPRYFEHHDPLPTHPNFGDEGAANHTRLAISPTSPGLHLFVYGRSSQLKKGALPEKYPARQSLEASKAIARLHEIPEAQVVFTQQSPHAIDKGVFHNDVISTGHENFFLYHEESFVDSDRVIKELQEKWALLSERPLHLLKIPNGRLSLEEAVSTYLFNLQKVTLPSGESLILAPNECRENRACQQILQELNSEVLYIDLKESMKNGGGPACLRLRVPLTEQEWQAVHPGVFLTEPLYQKLTHILTKHYRDRLLPKDLADPVLYHESEAALKALNETLLG